MSLKGNLSSVNLTEIFQMLSLSGREGTLFIYEGARKQAICFTKEGVSIRSRERNESNLLGKVLIRLGRLSEQDLRRAIQERRASNRLLGDVLVDLGACTREDVDEAFEIQCSEDLRDLFLNRRDAEFEYVDGYFPDSESGTMPVVNLAVNALLIDIARRSDEWEYIRRRICGPREVYQFTGEEAAVEEDTLNDCYADRVDPLIDGTHSVADLIELSYVNKFEVCKLLSKYLDAGLIEAVPPEALRQSARQALRVGDAARAIRHYQYLMSTGEYPLEVIAEAAEAHEGIRDYQEAAALLRRYAEELVRDGDYRGALEALRRVAVYPQPDAEALRMLVDLAFQEPKAAADFKTQIIAAGKALSTILLESEQRADALTLLEKLAKSFPDELHFAVGLVNVHYDGGNISRAVQECERLAKGFLKRRCPSPAVSLYKRLLVMDPERHDIRSKIKALGSGRRQSRLVPRLAVAAAVLMLVGGVGFVYWNKGQGKSASGRGLDPKALRDLLSQLDTEQAKSETDGRAAVKAFNALRKALKHPIEDGKAIVDESHRCEELFKKFQKHAGSTESIATTIMGRGDADDAAVGSRAALVALQDLRDKVAATRNAWTHEALKKARQLEHRGEAEYKLGRLRSALRSFTLANSLAGSNVGAKLPILIENVGTTIARAEKSLVVARRLESENDLPAAQRAYLRILKEYRNADIIEDLRLPVEIVTQPPGATVHVDGVEGSKTSPCYVRADPSKTTMVRITRPGFRENQFDIGPFDPELADVESLRFVRTLLKASTWVRNLRGRIESEPVVVGGRVVVSSRNGRYLVLDTKTGREVSKGVISAINGVSAGLASDGKRLFVPTLDGTLQVFSTKSYQRLPTLSGFKSGLYAAPVIDGTRIYLADHDGYIWCYDTRRLDVPLWLHPKTGVGVRAKPLLHGPHLVIVTRAGSVTVLDRKKGAKVAQYRLPGRYTVTPTPMDEDTLVFTSDDGIVLGVEKLTGKELWRHDLGSAIRSRPVLRGRGLFFLSSAEELVELDLHSQDAVVHRARSTQGSGSGRPMLFPLGNKLIAFARQASGGFGVSWTFQAEGRITADPVEHEGAVYVGDEKGNFYRIELE